MRQPASAKWKPGLPQESGRWTQLMHLSVWLFGWVIGETVVAFMIIAVLKGNWAAWGGMEYIVLAVMLVWLSGWTMGGLFAMRQWWDRRHWRAMS